MNIRLLQVVTVVLCLAFTALAWGAESAAKAGPGKSYTAVLTGKDVVPPVDTSAKGKAVFTVNEDFDGIDYTIDVSKIESVTGVHIHSGKKGKNGPPIVTLLEGQSEGEVEGNLVEGVVLEMDFAGPLEGKPLSALIDMLDKGEAYVNIHTEKFPKGELRGQIRK